MNIDINEIKIVPKPDYVSWEEITEVIHRAFEEKKEKGMNYLGSHQDVETTIKRVGNGICLVALHNDKVVGTLALKILEPTEKGRKWYNGNKYAYSSQLAVHPEYKGIGIGKMLMEKRNEICYQEKVDELLAHTSIHAKDMLNRWKKQGAQFVELLSSEMTNYYAVRMRIPIHGKRYNKFYVMLRYYFSAIKCVLYKNKYGKIRKIWKFF